MELVGAVATGNLSERFAVQFREGEVTQDLFTRSAQAAGYMVLPASEIIDKKEHIDVWIKVFRTYSVDIKGTKRLSRHGVHQGEYTCLELHGVPENNRGWLYDGRANLIAFEMTDTFLLVWREKLVHLVDFMVSRERVGSSAEAIYKVYSRRGYEQITWVETSVLRNPWFVFGEIHKPDDL